MSLPMSWKLFTSTFVAIFLAELGDKTQLAAFALAGESQSRWSIFFGASLALIATTALAVWVGGAVGKHVSPVWIRRGAGALFVVLGVIMLATSGSGTDTASAAAPAEETPQQ